MKKKVCLLVTLFLSLFLFCNKVNAAKELTCVYENGMGSYVTMLVQTSDGNVQYFAINTTIDQVKDINRIGWKKTSDFSDKKVTFYYESDSTYYENGDLTSCPQYTTGYVMGDTEVRFFSKNKDWWALFESKRYMIDADLSCEDCLPYVVSGETSKEDEITDIDESEWSSKCVYCSADSSAGCLDLYFNETEILLDNHRANIVSEKATFTINNIKNSYLFACPDRIYETYFDSYGVYEIPATTFSAEYHLTNPSTFGVTYNTPVPFWSGSEITGYNINYLYELTLDKESSKDEFEYKPGEFGSAFTDADIDNCEALLGDDLIGIINDIMNIVRVAVPILLIILGILDFTKATFSGSVEDMAKNRKRFINRIVAAVIVFLIPIFVNLLLTLANEVWGYINPTSCIK